MSETAQTPHEIYHALRRHATALGISPQEALELYAHERMLNRLSLQPEADEFVLKGAMMMWVWVGERLRTTRDMDLRGIGSPDGTRIRAILERACRAEVGDALEFEVSQLRMVVIKEAALFEGLQFHIPARLHKAQLREKSKSGSRT